ncbi:MAG: hypothetical protein N4A35_03050 [Flavobacteriales bacterium]|jgi:transcriptional regulator with XRE-family HTH domain|nr:hypothetical protein [Flavobacteriales bacterium]
MTTPHHYKYNILELLNELSVKQNKMAKKVLPLALKISKRTFELYCYIKIGERNNISPDKLQIIAQYFNCKVDDLLNEKVPPINYELLLEESK